jgi:glycosyltransferase involved in cell wall biosynthesis
MVVYSYYPLDLRVRKEARALVAKGHTVDVICLRDEGQDREEVMDGASIHRLSLTMRKGGYLTYGYQYLTFLLMSFATLTRLFLKHRHDVIHVHSLPDFQVFIALIPKLYGKKIVLDLHEAMPEIFAARFGVGQDSWQFRLAAMLETVSSWFADRIITVNDTIKARFVARGMEPDKITVVMNSPDETLRVEKNMSSFFAENDLEGKFILMYIGGLNPERDIEVLIQATSLLKDKIPIRLFVFGFGKEEYVEGLRQLATRLDVDQEVKFGGWVPQEDVFSYLDLSEIGIISYVRNPLTDVAVPNKVFEYVAVSKPLIIARLDALENLFRDSALFYEPSNAKDLANKILQLYQDKQLVKELSPKALEIYEKCKWSEMKERLYSAYGLSTA